MAFVLLFSGQAALADFYDGLRAHDAGDFRTAFAEWRAAADGGDAQAQFRLGQLYEEGLGVAQDFIQAHLYFNLAASQGHSDARAARDALAAKLTAEQLAEAQKRAAAWQPSAPAAAAARTAEREAPADLPPVSPGTELLAAISAGDVEAVREALDAGAPVDAKAANGWTALMVAIFYDEAEIAKALIEAGADVDAEAEDGATPGKMALLEGQDELVELIRSRGGSVPGTAPPEQDQLAERMEGGTRSPGIESLGLTVATINEELRARYELDEDIGGVVIVDVVEGSPAGDESLRPGDVIVEVSRKKVSSPPEVQAEVHQARDDEKSGVLLLIDRQGDLRFVAVKLPEEGGGELTRRKLAEEADLPEPGEVLIAAARAGDVEAVRELLAGPAAASDATSDGWTALMAAAEGGHSDVAALLLDAGADVEAESGDGATALLLATLGGYEDLVERLLAAGADPERATKTGVSATMVAREKGFDGIAARLEQAAAPDTNAVATAQQLLAQLGYSPGPPDGIAGARTRSAAEQFQRDYRLEPVDGKVTTLLLERLRTAAGAAARATESACDPDLAGISPEIQDIVAKRDRDALTNIVLESDMAEMTRRDWDTLIDAYFAIMRCVAADATTRLGADLSDFTGPYVLGNQECRDPDSYKSRFIDHSLDNALSALSIYKMYMVLSFDNDSVYLWTTKRSLIKPKRASRQHLSDSGSHDGLLLEYALSDGSTEKLFLFEEDGTKYAFGYGENGQGSLFKKCP